MLEISYHGAGFRGYQVQPNVKTVQGVLQQALQILLREQVVLYGCSRLDSGVHAMHFVLNFRTKSNLECDRILSSLNGIFHSHLNEAISVYKVWDAPLEFHARYSALGKWYRYLVWQGRPENALLTTQSWNVRARCLDLPLLCRTANAFMGTHDFGGFRASDCTAKTTTRTIHSVVATQDSTFPEWIVIDIKGDGFLKNMIRNIVGSCVDVAVGRKSQEGILNALQTGERALAGQCAPGHALTLMRVYY